MAPMSPAAPARRRLLLMLGGVALAGCATPKPPPPPPPPTSVALSLRADAGLNPDIHGRASPLVLRLYELKSAIAFERADFVSLYDRDQATLAAEFVSREEFIMTPGASRSWEKNTGADTRVLGVLAAYRNLEAARWRATVVLKPNQRNELVLRLMPAAAVFS